ncbi:MAG: hypothetical protein HY763_09530 [Planctomycetes bacterium]|nr:hypothetical protein [Planctomycetota bacterium]
MSRNHQLLCDLLSLPTAPFAESAVVAYVRAFCEARGLEATPDAAGNLLVHLRQGRRRVARPVCITAHLDHPGFVASAMGRGGRLTAYWRGGVPPEYFVGRAVRFAVDGRWVRGRIRSIRTVIRNGQRRVDTALLLGVARPVPVGAVGMWDFGDPVIRGTRIYARACDDLAGAAAMLCCLDTLVTLEHPCEAYFLFTRAEEVGFIGAIAAARARTIPRRCVVVAMETSSERPHARMGDGPILRVGDRASAFTPAATAYCHRIARGLQRADRGFVFQRKLMDGGTCESSAYCTLGYEATGLCIALGNYHNVNARRRTLGPEYVDLRDFDNVVKWFVELARAPHPYTGRDEALEEQLAELERTYAALLAATSEVGRSGVAMTRGRRPTGRGSAAPSRSARRRAHA